MKKMKSWGKEVLKKIGRFAVPLTFGVVCIAIHIIRKNIFTRNQIANATTSFVKKGDELYLILQL